MVCFWTQGQDFKDIYIFQWNKNKNKNKNKNISTPILSAARLMEQEVYLLKWVGPEKKGVSKIFF